MSNALPAPDEWDPTTEATRAFALTGDVKAVIFCSDVAVIRKAHRGPSGRKQDRLLRKLRTLLGEGRLEEAQNEVNRVSWPGPKAVWWTTSAQELADLIKSHDSIIRERKIAAGISVEPFGKHAVLFLLWWDR